MPTPSTPAPDLDPSNLDAQMRAGTILSAQVELAAGNTTPLHTEFGWVELQRGDASAARAAFFRGAPRGAEQTLKAVIAGDASQLDALANYEWATGAFAGAERTLESALKIEPQNAAAHRVLALLYITTNRRDEAEPHFRALAVDSAGRPPGPRGLLGQESRSPSHCRRADRRAVALCRGTHGKGTHAVERWGAAERSRGAGAYELLARVYVRQGRVEEAVQQYEALAERAPAGAAGARTMIGMLNEARKDREGARRAYEQALTNDPHAGVAANNLAWIYAEDGKLDQALRLATTAQASLRRRPEAEDTLGWIYLQKGLTSQAIAAFERARDRAPQNPVYHYHLGLAHLKSGDNARARTAFERALKLQPDFAHAADARAQLASMDDAGDVSQR